MSEHEPNWQQQSLEKVLLAGITEQRRQRRWNLIFRGLWLISFLIFLALLAHWIRDDETGELTEHTALVEINGVIGAGHRASADNIIKGLQEAFDSGKTKGVVLRINSPGGSPVHAGMINAEIRRLRRLHPNIPLYAVVDDICASGGYYVAVAADKIFVDKASIIGSIGVLMDGFGFNQALAKLGVERRLLTAGENKGFLDPFQPENPQQKAYAQSMLAEIHQQFIQAVREGRGARLKETPEMFSGLIWNGAAGVKLGLADAFGSVDSVARDIIKQDKTVDYTPQEDLADRLSSRLGTALAREWSTRWGQAGLH